MAINKGKIYSRLFLIICLLSGLLKIIYVFWATHYQSYLRSDCGGYWERAIDRFKGVIFDESQWNLKPPLYHIILSDIFKILHFFGILHWRLEAVLLIQIILCTLSVYVLYRISLDVTRQHLVSFLAASTYAFSYVMIYFKAFILSENMAIPFIIFSLWFIFNPSKWFFLMMGGILLGLTTGIRPSYGIMMAPCAVYLFFYKNDILLSRLKRLVIFLSAFFLVVTLVVLENNYISHGQKRMGANSGAIFLMTFLKPYKIAYHDSSHDWAAIPPATSGHPEYGTYTFDVPFYNNAYYFKLGIEFIKKNPKLLIQRCTFLKDLFFSPVMPAAEDALFFKPLLAFSRWEMLIMFLISLMIGFVFKSKRADNAKLLVLMALPVSFLIGFYFFNSEYRYLYSFAFVIHITCFATLAEIFRSRQLWGRNT